MIVESMFGVHGLPVPEFEYRFAPPRKWRFDWAWPAIKLAVEIEGGIWSRGRHVRGKGYLADLEKYNQAALLGWRLLRVTPDMVASGAAFELIGRVMKGAHDVRFVGA